MPVVLSRYHRFESYWEFEAFDQALTQQLSAGRVLAVDPPRGIRPQQASCYYQLPSTSQVWALSTPDNAWRGYFLPFEEALTYEAVLRSRNRRGQLGCLLAVVLGGALAAWLEFG